MGGIGSGNRWRSGRATCEGAKRIDLRYMRRNGLLHPYHQGSLSWTYNGEPSGNIAFRAYPDGLEVEYRCRPTGGEWQDVFERFPREQIAQPLGGFRNYLRCIRCDRRCLVLYGGLRFRCRRCLNLAYQSQSGDAADRAVMQMRKICKRLKSPMDDEFDYLPPRPRGMHRRTYERLARRHEAYEVQYESKLAGLMIHLQGLV